MKDIPLLVWLTQLGLSVAAPLAGFIMLALWLQNRFDLGNWIIWAGLVFGISGAVNGLRFSLKSMEQMSRNKRQQDPPPVSFNDHF